MKVVFLGTPQFAVPSLERLVDDPQFEVAAVVTQPDKRRGRGNELSPSPVKTVAVAHQLPVWQPRRIKKDSETLEQLRSIGADLFVVVAYGQILSPEILAMPRLGCVNGHGSILPRYRGAAPIQWCLYHGETETGITTMLMDAGMDTGAMLLKSTVAIGLFDTAADLATKLADLTADLLIDTLLGLDQGTITPIPQDDAQATYAPLIQKADFQLDWSRSALALHHQIRGFYPHCFTEFRGNGLKVIATVPLDAVDRDLLPLDLQSTASEWLNWRQKGTASEVVGILKNQGAIVQTGSGLLLLKEVQPAGKRVQSGWDFVNGVRLQVGERLG
ncbi:MAG: methionyl-tRNA formyltransferase [Elainella sp. Prado103]|nr:methionyl-tRNA formyltransferase [Elainella sp. Prado103]